MKYLVTGGTGLVGRALCQALLDDGHEVVVLTRLARPSHSPRQRFVGWSPPVLGSWTEELDGADGVVHLAGESVVAGRWTPEQKRRIVESRVGSTETLVRAMRQAA
ncbi:MAG: NAD-dependent epimerase/dehydratase family protein, partial [Candidatus Omnitrophica bacterium]|nr:NAD-dependent epimerase/dehydratase family protein [Candidatus Omnitrophota bacterium]